MQRVTHDMLKRVIEQHRHLFAVQARLAHIEFKLKAMAVLRRQPPALDPCGSMNAYFFSSPELLEINISRNAARAVAADTGFAAVRIEDARIEGRTVDRWLRYNDQ